jgi:AcrR family transcriptional regulator
MTRRNYAGQTGSERAAVRRAALLDAALDLVGEAGWAPLSIEAICRRAALNKRYFYESFASLDEVMAALIERVARETIDACLQAVPVSGTAEQLTAAVVRTMVEHVTDDRRRARVLFEAPAPGGEAAARRAALTREAITLAAARARTVFPGGDATAFALSAAVVVGGTSQAVLDWLHGGVDCTRDELIDGLVTMWLAVGAAVSAPSRG